MASTAPLQRAQNGAELLIRSLEAEGVRYLFGYPGGAIMPVYDALPTSDLIHVLVRHEQGAALAADAFGRVTGRPGVCLATSGPGATNLVTGLANAFMDSVPVVAITGQVATSIIGTDGFQEIDIIGVTLPIVKHSYLVRDARDIPAVVRRAFALASHGRPGPVLIDLPKDVAQQEVTDSSSIPAELPPLPKPDAAALDAANRLIERAEKPVLYIGGGVAIARAEAALRELAARAGMPIVATLKGLGAVPTDSHLFLGMLGMHGSRAANVAVDGCDLLICIGARFDERATGKLETFASHARVIHVDADGAEVGKLRRPDVALIGEMNGILNRLKRVPRDIDAWVRHCQTNKRRWTPCYDAPGAGIYAPQMLKQLSETAGDDLIVTCDVGQHQMWVAQHCRFVRPQAHLTSAGLGTMGYGIPAGIGALIAEPDATVVTVTGDGSIMMNIQELATLRRYRLPLKILLLDNGALGMVRQWQQLLFEENFSEVDLFDNPDFAEIARAFGIEAFTIDRRSEVSEAIERLLAARGPILCHARIDPGDNVWPLVPPNKPNCEMIERRS